jgi:DNA-binding winged helix-turn-helix (wHTH) protein
VLGIYALRLPGITSVPFFFNGATYIITKSARPLSSEAKIMGDVGRPAVLCYLDVLGESGAVVQEIPVARPVRVGRASPDSTQDIVIPAEHRSASRQHAVIEPRHGQIVLTDQSRLGTVVNGRLVHCGSIDLHHGDEVVFGLPQDGWRVRFRAVGSPDKYTSPADPLEMLTVSETPRQVRIGRLVVEEHLGGPAFRLLKFLADHKGNWYPVAHLEGLLWPDPDSSPYQTQQSLSRAKKAINDLLRQHLKGQDTIESWPRRGYRMKSRLDTT